MRIIILAIVILCFNLGVAQTKNSEIKIDFNLLSNYIRGSNAFQLAGTDTINRIDTNGLKQGLWKVKYQNARMWETYFVNDTVHGDFVLKNAAEEILMHGTYIHGFKEGLWHYNVPFAGKDSIYYQKGVDTNISWFKWTDLLVSEGQYTYILPIGYSFFWDKWENDTIKDQMLKPLLEFLRMHPKLSVELIGNTGIAQANDPIYSTIESLRLPKNIYKYLIANGIEAKRLSYKTNEDSRFIYLLPVIQYHELFNSRVDVRISGSEFKD